MYYEHYMYKNADVVGYFIDSEKIIQIVTMEGIYPFKVVNYETGVTIKWIEENLRYFSKEQLKNYINSRVDGYLLWKGIKAQYFKKDFNEKKKEKKKKEKVKIDVKMREDPDLNRDRTDTGRDYYWPLGEIELEEVQF